MTSLLFAPLLGACPPTPAAQTTASGSSTGSQTTGTTGEATTGECPIGDIGCPCTQGGGCNPGLICGAGQVCVDEAGTTGTATSTTGEPTFTTTIEPGTTTTDSSTTMRPVMCDAEDGNQPNFDCLNIDPNQPYCADTNVCGGCTVLPPDNGCELVAPGKPICNAEDGQCVACTEDDDSQCGGDTPACNPVTNACEGCFDHSHCPETACDILARKCFPTNQIIYVRHGIGDNGECTNNVWQGGTIDAPYCTANQAIDHAQYEGASSGWTIKFLETDLIEYDHGKIVAGTVGEPVSYAFVHEGDFSQEVAYYRPHARLVSPDPVVTVGANVTAYFKNFVLTSTGQSDNATGVTCLPGGNIVLDDSVVRDARGPGIRSAGCNVYLNRSSVYGGKTEGIELSCAEEHCELHMVNSYISENLYYQGKGGGGITAENATLNIAYSTILANNNEFDMDDPMGRGDSIHCIGDAVDGTISNSVIARTPLGNIQSMKCDPVALQVTNSLLDSDLFKLGNNKKASETILPCFQHNTVIGARPVFKSCDLLADMAELVMWAKGDPRVDFDGDARVGEDEQENLIGADVL